MTLITYPTRVHLADGILEEALHSELESAGCRSALIVSDKRLSEGTFMDRVLGGIPTRTHTQQIAFLEHEDLRAVAADASDRFETTNTIVAFGTARAIELGRKIRFSIEQRKRKRPKLFALPGVDGLPDPCTRNMESTQAGLPAVVICDPTVSMGADKEESLSAAVMSLTRCLETYLCVGYNPPADGMALDGVSRCIECLKKIGKDANIELHREVMAAGLNAFLSQNKGVGPTQRMTAILTKDALPDRKAAVARLLLPGIMRARSIDTGKADVLQRVLSTEKEPLSDATKRILSGIKMPETLALLGIPRETLDVAARAVAGNEGLTYGRAKSVLDEIYESA